jgi:hypothetical protein
MHVEPSSPLASNIAAMWFLPILNMGAIPLLGLHFQVSGILASGGDKRAIMRLVASAATAANHDLLWGELMTRGRQGQKRRACRLGVIFPHGDCLIATSAIP